MGLTMGDLGDFMRLNPGALPPDFITGRTGQFTPEARAVIKAMEVASVLRENGHPEQPPAPLNLPVGDPVYGGCLPKGCCPPAGMIPLRSNQEVTQNTLDVTPLRLRQALNDTMSASPKVVFGPVAPNVRTAHLKITAQPIPVTLDNMIARRQIQTFNANVRTLNMATGGEGAAALAMAQAYTTPRQMMGLGTLGALQADYARSILSSARAQSARGNYAEAERYLAQVAEMLNANVQDAMKAGLFTEFNAVRAQVLRDKQRAPETVDRYNEGVKAGEQAASAYRGYSETQDMTRVYGEAAWNTARTINPLLNAPSAAGKAAANAAAGAQKIARAAGNLIDRATKPAQNTWGIFEWITEHPVLTALGVVGAGAAVAYAHGRGGRR